jgi:hypothetical protein
VLLNLSLLFRLDRSFRRLESDFGMRSVAEWLVHGRATATQSDGLLPGDVKFVAVSIRDLNLAEISGYQVRAVLFRQDVNCHDVSSVNLVQALNLNG